MPGLLNVFMVNEIVGYSELEMIEEIRSSN
jgi:hypothetical protein